MSGGRRGGGKGIKKRGSRGGSRASHEDVSRFLKCVEDLIGPMPAAQYEAVSLRTLKLVAVRTNYIELEASADVQEWLRTTGDGAELALGIEHHFGRPLAIKFSSAPERRRVAATDVPQVRIPAEGEARQGVSDAVPNTAAGTCYKAALDAFLSDNTVSGGVLLHGRVNNGIGHAWVENMEHVWDPQFGLVNRDAYYDRFRPEVHARYSRDEAARAWFQAHHSGPWVDPPGSPLEAS